MAAVECKATLAAWPAASPVLSSALGTQRAALPRHARSQVVVEHKGDAGVAGNRGGANAGVPGTLKRLADCGVTKKVSGATAGGVEGELASQSSGSVAASPLVRCALEGREWSAGVWSTGGGDPPLPHPHHRRPHRNCGPDQSAETTGDGREREKGQTGGDNSPARDNAGNDLFSYGYNWPMFLAVAPPLARFLFGNSEAWSDFLLIVLIAVYLHYTIKVPWELYYSAVEQEALATPTHTIEVSERPDDQMVARQQKAAVTLRRQKYVSLCLMVVAPLFSGWTLHVAKASHPEYEKYISKFNVPLFVMAATMRPLSLIVALAKGRALALQYRADFPHARVNRLVRRVGALESELASLKGEAAATHKAAEEVTKAAVMPSLEQLSRAVKRGERRDDFLRGYSEERFHQLENRVREQEKTLQLVAAQVAALRAIAESGTGLDGGAPPGEKRRRRSSVSSLIASTALFPVTSAAWMCGFIFRRLPSWLFLPSPRPKSQRIANRPQQTPDDVIPLGTESGRR